jgi:hypothetical protein
MRLTAMLWLIGVCAVCASARADQTGPADRTLAATTIQSAPLDPSKDPVYVCPMDPDVRSHNPGTCRRCGMNLVAGIPDPVEFHLDLGVVPQPPQPAHPAALQFFIHDPWKDRPVSGFNVVHERFFHAFVVSEDLEFFEHGHPSLVADGVFRRPPRVSRSYPLYPGTQAVRAPTGGVVVLRSTVAEDRVVLLAVDHLGPEQLAAVFRKE